MKSKLLHVLFGVGLVVTLFLSYNIAQGSISGLQAIHRIPALQRKVERERLKVEALQDAAKATSPPASPKTVDSIPPGTLASPPVTHATIPAINRTTATTVPKITVPTPPTTIPSRLPVISRVCKKVLKLCAAEAPRKGVPPFAIALGLGTLGAAMLLKIVLRARYAK